VLLTAIVPSVPDPVPPWSLRPKNSQQITTRLALPGNRIAGIGPPNDSAANGGLGNENCPANSEKNTVEDIKWAPCHRPAPPRPCFRPAPPLLPPPQFGKKLGRGGKAAATFFDPGPTFWVVSLFFVRFAPPVGLPAQTAPGNHPKTIPHPMESYAHRFAAGCNLLNLGGCGSRARGPPKRWAPTVPPLGPRPENRENREKNGRRRGRPGFPDQTRAPCGAFSDRAAAVRPDARTVLYPPKSRIGPKCRPPPSGAATLYTILIPKIWAVSTHPGFYTSRCRIAHGGPKEMTPSAIVPPLRRPCCKGIFFRPGNLPSELHSPYAKKNPGRFPNPSGPPHRPGHPAPLPVFEFPP